MHIVTDRRADGDGSDLLIGIETLRFGDDPAGAPDSDAFVIQLAGVIDNPFEGFA